MKVYIVTADDIGDGYPEKVFSTREAAEMYLEGEYQKEKAEYDALPPHPQALDFKFSKDNFYSEIVEMEVEQ